MEITMQSAQSAAIPTAAEPAMFGAGTAADLWSTARTLNVLWVNTLTAVQKQPPNPQGSVSLHPYYAIQ